MEMVNVVYWLPIGRLTAQVDYLGSKVGSHWHFLHLSRESGELSQYFEQHDSTIKIIIIIIIINYYYYYY